MQSLTDRFLLQPPSQITYRLNLLLAAWPSVLLSHLSVSLLLVVALWGRFPTSWVLGWFGSVVAICGMRLLIYRYLKLRPLSHEPHGVPRAQDEGMAARKRHWAWLLMLGQFAQALPMPLAIGIFSDPAQPVIMFLIVSFTALVLAGGMFTSAQWIPGFAAIAAPTVGITLVSLFVLDIQEQAILIGQSLLMLGFAVTIVRKQSGMVGRLLDLQLEKDRLVDSLQVEKSTAIAAREAAEEAGQSKSRFFAAASHDLRQPLHALTLLVGQLRNEARPATQAPLVEQVSASAASLSALFDDLLSLSQLDRGDLSVKPRPVRLGVLLNKLAAQMRPLAQQRGLRLRVHARALTVHADPLILTRVLSNLLANALVYTRQGGVLMGMRLRGEAVRIEVWDTGIGIAPQEQGRVFEEFYQLHNPERDQAKGLGIGLATVRRLTDACAWPLGLRSRPGQGSCFFVTVPLAHAPPVEEPAAPQAFGGSDEPGVLYGLRVLVVDDQKSICNAMLSVLGQWGCDARAATTPAEALRHARPRQDGDTSSHDSEGDWQPELIISDLWLTAGASGLDLVLQLRGLLGRALPALLVSGDTSAHALQLAAHHQLALLHKPVPPDVLRDKLHEMLVD
ncbi:ATP-binding response regulator [Variovorax terrae]|uniref:histidine kinase n=1 Tax=Variovorax terrae TaxID=2923278 RepID=A0A9X2APL3_9BURK|nr:HAMP domain-containing sensor histidine kinase [Variovorax terrae]MCJ0763642.1 ATP-binding protein [Variovorax terrae]